MPLLCVIPARIGSTRLQEKPLRLVAGIPLISRVAERVLRLGFARQVVVAADDPRILEAVRELPVDGVLSEATHQSGTERVAEVVARPAYRWAELVVNLQGDEPLIPLDAISGAVGRVVGGDDVGTAAAPLASHHAGDPNRVKVRIDEGGRAVRFVRAALPAVAGGGGHGPRDLQHLGVYAYRPPVLQKWVRAMPVPDEVADRLEQLRPLALGMTVGVAVLEIECPPGVDTEDDLRAVQKRFDHPAADRRIQPRSRAGVGTGVTE